VNVKEYISSGAIESYVMGFGTNTEREEFEQLCQQYPEIAEARTAFELALKGELLKDAPRPPAFLKQRIEEALKESSQATETVETEEEKTVRRVGPWKWLAAASLILLAGAVYWAFNTNNKYQELVQTNNKLEQELSQSKEKLAFMEEDARMMQKPGIKMIALKGTSIAPQAYTTVYWDTTGSTRDVYLLVNNLPQPQSDKQYQLWALLNGQPIDLGMIDNSSIRQNRLLTKMQNVQNAQAFAITLEPKGGSQSPTLDSMYVMGQL
jgi:anti-sigma-K factor RskA